MEKLMITVLGKDRPGIIAAVTKTLYRLDCNLENVNQMILQNQFAGFFIIEPPATLSMPAIEETLKKDLADTGLRIHVDGVEHNGSQNADSDYDLFIVTTIGPDQKGLVARLTEIISSYGVNVSNLKAVFKGGNDPTANIMTYEIMITADTDQSGLFSSLRTKAAELGLDISIQHKNIFQTINKI